MSRLVKFPNSVRPDRVSQRLVNLQEMSPPSPTAGVQQIASRNRGFWVWSFQYTDISESEREIVESFLMSCQGAVNPFYVEDPTNYRLTGSGSDWVDVYSGYGDFTVTAGSETTRVNSWFTHTGILDHHVQENGVVAFTWKSLVSQINMRWNGHANPGIVNSLQHGAAYAQRLKMFNAGNPTRVSLAVGSSDNNYYVSRGPLAWCYSADNLTIPFVAHVNTLHVSVVDWVQQSNHVGDMFFESDYRLQRCALVSNSENLLEYSNAFDSGNWTTSMSNVASGYVDRDTYASVVSGGWKFFADTSVNTTHSLQQQITKITTEDVYTFSVYAREAELRVFRLSLRDPDTSGFIRGIFNLGSGTVVGTTVSSPYDRGVYRMHDVGSGFYRCSVSVVVSSADNLIAQMYLYDNASSISFTGNGSDGVEILHAQVKKHPFPGRYLPTTSETVVASENQSGTRLYLEGFDPDEVAFPANTRMEIVNRFHSSANSYYERSEMKRLTRDLVVGAEGWAVAEFEPPLRNTPRTARSDRAQDHLGETLHNPVLFHRPQMKARLIGGTVQIDEKPLKMTDVAFEIIEELTE